MRWEDALPTWRAQDEAAGAGPDPAGADAAELLALVKRRSDAFERTIRMRDRLELGAAVAVVGLAVVVLVSGPWLSRIGALVLVAGALVVVARLRSARRRPLPADRPLAERLRAELDAVDAQIRLLRSILGWYIAPLAAGALLIFAGVAGATWWTAGYAAVVLAFSAFVHRLNRRAVRAELLPRRGELERLLAQIRE